MKFLRRVVSVRLEEGPYQRLRQYCLRSGVPMSALIRTLVYRWLDEQQHQREEAPSVAEPRRRWSERDQQSLFAYNKEKEP